MYYFDNSFFIKSKKENFSVYHYGSLSKEDADSIDDAITISLQKCNANKFHQVTKKNRLSYLTKANTIRHRNGRIRSTLGIKRRGSYDWAVAEIDNQIKLQGIDYIPKIIGYGTARGKSGIVKSISIVTEFKDNTYNLLEYINKFPNKVHSSIIVSFKLIKRHLDDNLIHLDLWGGNILVNKDLSKSWLIDLELLKRSPKRSFEEKIGFCLGYLYKHTAIPVTSIKSLQQQGLQ